MAAPGVRRLLNANVSSCSSLHSSSEALPRMPAVASVSMMSTAGDSVASSPASPVGSFGCRVAGSVGGGSVVGSAPGVGGSFRGGDPSSFRGSEGWIHRASFSAKGKSPPEHQGERRSCGHSSSSRGASPPQQREGSPPGSRGSREGSGHASRAAGAVASHHPHQPPRAKLINPFIGAELMKVVGATKTLSSFSCALRRASDAAVGHTHTSSHLPPSRCTGTRAAAGSTSPNTSSTNGPRSPSPPCCRWRRRRRSSTNCSGWATPSSSIGIWRWRGPAWTAAACSPPASPHVSPPPPPSTGGGVGGGAHGDAVRDADERRGVTARARVSAAGPRLPAAGIDAALGVGGPPRLLPLALAAASDHHNDEGAEVDDARVSACQPPRVPPARPLCHSLRPRSPPPLQGAVRFGQDQHRVPPSAAPAVRPARAAVRVFGRQVRPLERQLSHTDAVSSPTSPPHQLGEGRRLPLERVRPDRLRLPAPRRTRLHRRPRPRPAGAGLPHCHHRLLHLSPPQPHPPRPPGAPPPHQALRPADVEDRPVCAAGLGGARHAAADECGGVVRRSRDLREPRGSRDEPAGRRAYLGAGALPQISGDHEGATRPDAARRVGGGRRAARPRAHAHAAGRHDREGAGGAAGRRMFVQVEVDATARADQAWRLEFRWFMCRGTKVEDFITSTIRQANKAGLLLLQIPTGRRPRPFSPPLTVRVAEPLRHAASLRCVDSWGSFARATARRARE